MSILGLASSVSSTASIAGSVLSVASLTKAFVAPQDDLPEGIAGFLFDIPESETLSLAAQITDNYIENNTAIQDHIAFEPARFTLVGLQGELIYEQTKATKFARTLLDRLTPLGVLSPEVSTSAAKAIAAADQLTQAVDSAFKEFGNLSDALSADTAPLNRQQEMFQKFEKYFYGRTLLSVQTPWRYYQNMAIENINFERNAETNSYTRVTITLKEMRFASIEVGTGQLFGRIDAQKSDKVNKGKTTGKSLAATGVDGVWSSFKSLLGN